MGAGWLALCSIFFYAWWDYRYVLLLAVSIIGNYQAGRWIAAHQGTATAKRLLVAAIAANILLLSYYKYADFFIGSTNYLLGTGIPLMNIILPIGISFFTFTRSLSLSIHTKARSASSALSLLRTVCHLFPAPHRRPGIASQGNDAAIRQGPELPLTRREYPDWSGCLRHRSVQESADRRLSCRLCGPRLRRRRGPVFVAWGGLLAYSFQLYFDFSACSDMAIGLSRLFGIKLPLNFNSPYKAANITDFWRRWHMTLSRFLRDYLYIPLGGNGMVPGAVQINLGITMLLGGLWHGAGWTFVIWGGLHGLFLMIHHAWQETAARFGRAAHGRAATFVGVLLTFFCVNIAWVFFRADIETATSVLRGDFRYEWCRDTLSHPLTVRRTLPPLPARCISVLSWGAVKLRRHIPLVAAAMFVTFCFPNTQELLRRYVPALPDSRQDSKPAFALFPLRWAPAAHWAIAIGLAGAAGILSLTRPSVFLYFQF